MLFDLFQALPLNPPHALGVAIINSCAAIVIAGDCVVFFGVCFDFQVGQRVQDMPGKRAFNTFHVQHKCT